MDTYHWLHFASNLLQCAVESFLVLQLSVKKQGEDIQNAILQLQFFNLLHVLELSI